MNKLNNPHVLCLGEILFDRLADQLGSSLEIVKSWTSYPGGAPANVACALVKLGTPAAFIGCVGQDKLGNELVNLLEHIGVNTSGVQRHSTAPTRQVYVLRSEAGDRSFAGFGDRQPDEFADAYLQAEQLPTELFNQAEFLVIGTLELAYPETRNAVFSALKMAKDSDIKVVLDINWRPMFWQDETEAMPLIEQLWQYADFVKLATEEAEWLFGTTDAAEIFNRLDSVTGVLVSGGDADVSYCLNHHQGTCSPFPMEVVDTTGAGDAFLAGFIHQLCQKGTAFLENPETVKEIVTYACAVGGLTTTKPGAIAAQPTGLEVEEFIK
jgi:fructokinase